MQLRTALVLLPVFGAVLLAPLRPDSNSGPARAVVEERADSSFAALVARLSEPGGYFSSDNLVSNEASYLHVLGRLRELGVRGGAYVGVGPDQNFSYIARLRPEIAFMLDIRRDNLLHHLMLKAFFEHARNRIEYLCMVTGRVAPADPGRWDDASIQEIVEYIDVMPPDSAAFEDAQRRVRASIERYGVPITDPELTTLRRFHAEFHRWGLDIRYSNRFGVPLWNMPSYRQLLVETDLDGNQLGYLADEESFRYLREMQRRDRIIPVTGDLAGDHALVAIGREIAARGLRLTALYVSNVEQYLMRDASFRHFADNVATLPFDGKSVIIRSYFGRGWPHRDNVPGYYATQLLERITDFVAVRDAGGYTSYLDLVRRNVLPLRDTATAAR